MTDELIGKSVNGYDILSLIGQGGMASVYLARQQSMDRQVALKVLPKQFVNDDTYLQRFNREVQIVSQLEHRNIVPVYDYGQYDSQPYIVMRYMPAGSVDDLLMHGALAPEAILGILAQIAPALDYAHSKGVLHRDLKPSNILMDEAQGAYITDFGIARLAHAKGVTITTQGVVGTPSYMSPEQAQGRELDGRSDVYSLGVMLFEMATGRRPFESETPYSIAVMQVTTPPPSPRAVNSRVSLSLESVILKALRKHPDERYQTAQELLEAVKRAIETPNIAPMPAEPTPAPQAIVPNVTPHPYQPRYTPAVSHAYPPAKPKPAPASPLIGLLMGGSIGCLGLLLVAGLIFVVAMWLLPPAPTPNAFSTNTPEAATPTLDATSEAARKALLQQQSDATHTAPAPAVTPSASEGALPQGVLVFAGKRGNNPNTMEIVTLDLQTGEERLLTNNNSDDSYPIASPSGRWIAFQSIRDGDWDIYVMDTSGGQVRPLTFNTYFDRVPSWSPDGEWVIYSSDVRGDGAFDLYRTRFDGSQTELVLSDNERKSHARYSPDGRYIVYTSGVSPRRQETWEIMRYDTQTGEKVRLTDNDTRDASPLYSADGTRILYITTHNGTNAIAEMNADGTNRRILYDTPANEWAASYSPDEQFIVVTSLSDVDEQLVMVNSDGTNPQVITFNGGNYASWVGK